MSIFRLITITLSITLLVACGGGGGGGGGLTATTGTPAGVEPPREITLGGRTVTIGDENGVAPLSGLNSFTPSMASPTMQAVIENRQQRNYLLFSDFTGVENDDFINSHSVPSDQPYYSGQVAASDQPFRKYTRLPDDPINPPFCSDLVGGCLTQAPPFWDLFDIRSDIRDLSFVSVDAVRGRNSGPAGVKDYFDKSTYRSRISSTEKVGDISFARGNLKVTRISGEKSTPLEFETFAGWLDGGVFGSIQLSIGESGGKEYLFTSYYLGNRGQDDMTPSGTGSATWEGAAVASIKNATAIEDGWGFVRGEATIGIEDLANPEVDLRFDNWHTINGREVSLPATTFDNIPLGEGSSFFSPSRPDTSTALDRMVKGEFHGDNHKHVGGTFYTETLSGAFGAVRQ